MAKYKKFNMAKYKKFKIEQGWYRVKELSKGEFVKKSPYGKKIYIVGNYNRLEKMYEMNHADDISMQSLVNGNKKVWAGFLNIIVSTAGQGL